jgi:hypothetical protein
MPANATVSTEQRIEEAHQGAIGVMTGMLALREKLGDKGVNLFLDSVEERGEVLWTKFRTARDKGEADSFVQFAAKVVMPKLMNN